MGYSIEELIGQEADHNYEGEIIPDIQVSGNSVSDTIYITQGDSAILLSVMQARELLQILRVIY